MNSASSSSSSVPSYDKLADANHVGILLGGKGHGRLNMLKIGELFGGGSFDRETAYNHIAKLQHDHVILKMPMRYAQIPRGINYSVDVDEDNTEIVILTPSVLVEFESEFSIKDDSNDQVSSASPAETRTPNSKLQCGCSNVSSMIPMHRPGDGAIICARCCKLITMGK